MKQFFLLCIFLSLALVSFSQSYQTIQSNQVGYYGTTVNALPFLAGTPSVNNNGDTLRPLVRVFQNDKVDSLAVFDCYERSDTSWFGLEHLQLATGDEVFFNQFGDSILLKPQAIVGNSWIAYTGTTLQVVATVTGVTNQPFLGIQDSVKTIALQVQDLNGLMLTHPLNAETIQLSQHYGIYAAPSFFDFPTVGEFLQLVGHSNLDDGLHNITKRDIYNFEVGDTFQYLHTYREEDGFFTYEWSKYYQRVILSKNETTSGVTYQVHFKRLDINNYGDSSWVDNIETMFFGYNTTTLDNEPYIPFSNDTKYMSLTNAGFINFNGRVRKREIGPFVLDTNNGINGCWTYSNNYPFVSTFYGEGLGQTNYSYYEGEFIVINENDDLKYYNKSGETWGTPYPQSLFAPPVATKSIRLNPLKIYPNPATTQLTVELPITAQTNPLSIQVFDALGRLVQVNTQQNQNIFTVQVAALPNGLYSILISDGQDAKYQGRFLK